MTETNDTINSFPGNIYYIFFQLQNISDLIILRNPNRYIYFRRGGTTPWLFEIRTGTRAIV